MFRIWVHGFRFRFKLRICDSGLFENAKPRTPSPQKHKPSPTKQTPLTTRRLYTPTLRVQGPK